mmetsp:Transcript_47501/g.128168  ORF Transcript_47501/g.128168 Transcript_47501/m.128168 type:complete len:262 (+) Transcript_47501:323-1108(+)
MTTLNRLRAAASSALGGHDEALDELGRRRRAPVTQSKRQSLLDRPERGRPDEVGRLEEFLEGELLALGLQEESPPLVERCRDQAAEDHHDEQHLGRGDRPAGVEGENANSAVVARDAVHDVTDDSRRVRLVNVGPVHLEIHRLAVPVVRHWQGGRSEDEAREDPTVGGADRECAAECVDGLEERELQEVGGQRRLEEVEHLRRAHVVDGLHDLHALDQHAVHDGLAHRREGRLDDRGHRACTHRVDDLRHDAGGGRRGLSK